MVLKIVFHNNHFYVNAFGFVIILSEQWSKIQLKYVASKTRNGYKEDPGLSFEDWSIHIGSTSLEQKMWNEDLLETKHYFAVLHVANFV